MAPSIGGVRRWYASAQSSVIALALYPSIFSYPPPTPPPLPVCSRCTEEDQHLPVFSVSSMLNTILKSFSWLTPLCRGVTSTRRMRGHAQMQQSRDVAPILISVVEAKCIIFVGETRKSPNIYDIIFETHYCCCC